jgi:hypothetical protein
MTSQISPWECSTTRLETRRHHHLVDITMTLSSSINRILSLSHHERKPSLESASGNNVEVQRYRVKVTRRSLPRSRSFHSTKATPPVEAATPERAKQPRRKSGGVRVYQRSILPTDINSPARRSSLKATSCHDFANLPAGTIFERPYATASFHGRCRWSPRRNGIQFYHSPSTKTARIRGRVVPRDATLFGSKRRSHSARRGTVTANVARESGEQRGCARVHNSTKPAAEIEAAAAR